MNFYRFGGYAGIIFSPLLMLILGILGDDASNDRVTNAAYLADLGARSDTIQRIAGLGLLSLLFLLVHVEWLSDIVSQHSQIWSRVARAGALIAAMGIALSYGLTLIIGNFATNEFQNEMLRSTGLVAANLPAIFFIGMAVFAGAIATLGWRGRFPKWLTILSTIEVVLVVVSTANGAPGGAALPTAIWIIVNAIGLLLANRKDLKKAS